VVGILRETKLIEEDGKWKEAEDDHGEGKTNKLSGME
jgi:hypothetical protein